MRWIWVGGSKGVKESQNSENIFCQKKCDLYYPTLADVPVPPRTCHLGYHKGIQRLIAHLFHTTSCARGVVLNSSFLRHLGFKFALKLGKNGLRDDDGGGKSIVGTYAWKYWLVGMRATVETSKFWAKTVSVGRTSYIEELQ